MIEKTFIEGLFIISPEKFNDDRGWFQETFNDRKFSLVSDNILFVQDNHSFSEKKGTLRGLHFQKDPSAQAKLVRCSRGRVFDVAVDLRKSSKTYLKWYGIELSPENGKQLFIPRGFAHAFLTLEDNSEFQYKVDNYYNKENDRTIRFDDQSIGIIWPIDEKQIILSDKDANAPYLKDSDVDFE